MIVWEIAQTVDGGGRLLDPSSGVWVQFPTVEAAWAAKKAAEELAPWPVEEAR